MQIDPRKIREDAAKKSKDQATAVTGDIVTSVGTTDGADNEQAPAQEAPDR